MGRMLIDAKIRASDKDLPVHMYLCLQSNEWFDKSYYEGNAMTGNENHLILLKLAYKNL